MKLSDEGLKAIGEHEGLRLTAYPDPGTGGAPWTIGFGHTGPDVYPGLVITYERALEWLREDVHAAEQCVNRWVRVPLTQGMFDALVSFVFNCGAGNFIDSTLLKKLNAGDKAGAAAEFLRWNKAAGKVMAGLTKRRADEAERFLA